MRRYAFEQESFDVDFSRGGWRFELARALPPFPRGHWLEGLFPSGLMVVFDVGSSGSLRVPSVELFSRCYGSSHEVRRVLATYGWDEARERLLPPPGRSSTPERPVVRIVPPFVYDDAVFLASLRHSCFTQRAAREVYSRLDAGFRSSSAPGVVLKAGPWFEGPATLVVEGERLTDTGVFLAHRIVGGSLPPGPDIEVVRDYAPSAGAVPGSSPLEAGGPLSPRHPPPDPVEVTADTPPGRGAGHTEVRDDPFVVVGPRRGVTVRCVSCAPRERRLPGSDAARPDVWAAGDAVGADMRVGEVRVHIPATHPSDGLLLDMWNALCRERADPSSALDSVEWYAWKGVFHATGPPRLLRFPRFPAADARRRTWIWLDPKEKCTRRGVLVLRCVVDGRAAYVVDVQRRPATPGKEGESFSTLVFTLAPEAALDAWLGHLLCAVRETRGVFGPHLGRCPGSAAAFRHPPRSSKHFSKLAARNVVSEIRGL